MAARSVKVPAGLKALDEKASNAIIAAVRILVGVLWLANIEWKRPSDFGKDLGNGLYKYVDSAVRNPVFPPYSWFVENVVLKQYRLFGWITLITEILLAALLLLGLKTRWVSLVGVGLSFSILFSVLFYDKVVEWPWSYYMMIGIHLILFATDAGKYFGIDGVRSGHLSAIRSRYVLGALTVIVGLIGWLVSRNAPFSAKQGTRVGFDRWELKVLWFNQLSALLTLAGGVALLLAARPAMRLVRYAVAAFFAVLTVLVMVLWRYNAGKWTGGFLGATGATAAFWVMLPLGILAIERAGSRNA